MSSVNSYEAAEATRPSLAVGEVARAFTPINSKLPSKTGAFRARGSSLVRPWEADYFFEIITSDKNGVFLLFLSTFFFRDFEEAGCRVDV